MVISVEFFKKQDNDFSFLLPEKSRYENLFGGWRWSGMKNRPETCLVAGGGRGWRTDPKLVFKQFV